MKHTLSVVFTILAASAFLADAQCAGYNLYVGGYDLLGLFDVGVAGVNNRGGCCDACSAFPGCNTWVYRENSGECYLKSTPNCVAPRRSYETALTAGQLSTINGASCTPGNTPTPPAPVPTPPASVCGNGVVEGSEQCDNGSCCTSSCTFASSASVCRASAGACDVAETCSGSSSTCPADAFASGSVCRASAGACDLAETCDGTGASCPVDNYAARGTVCRAAVNNCDITETCNGNTTSCPADALSQTTSCFCARQSLQDGEMGYFCNANGGFYQCLGGVFAPQSRDMPCAGGTHCGCDFGVECSCSLAKSPCVFSGEVQSC